MKMLQRVLAWLLCFVMAFSLLPAPAFAADGGEEPDEPAAVEQTADEDLPASTQSDGEPEGGTQTGLPAEDQTGAPAAGGSDDPAEGQTDPASAGEGGDPENGSGADEGQTGAPAGEGGDPENGSGTGEEPVDEPPEAEPQPEAQDEPSITIEAQPENAVPADGAAEFAVRASVNTEDSLACQWQRLDESAVYADDAAREAAWQDMEGQTGAVLRLSGLDDEEALAEAMKYAYRCVLTAGELRTVTGEARLVMRARLQANASRGTVASGSCGENLTWTLYDDGELVISGTGAMKDFGAASSSAWYSYRSQITRVVISSGATTVGSYAFSGFTNLTSVSLPNTLETIKQVAFANCASLSAVVIPNSVTMLGASAFKDDPLLRSATLSSGLTQIPDSAFSGCSGLTSISIPSGVTKLGPYAFSRCSSLKSVSFPSTLTEIGTYAFSACTSLTSVTLPESVATVATYAFNNCTGLTSVTIKCPDVSVANASFQNCSAITTVTSPSWRVFNNCTPSKLIIPNTVTALQSSAFINCSFFTTVTVPATLTGIGERAFENCSGLMSISLPSGVTTIGSSAFRDCAGLTSFAIPNGVTTLQSYLFSGCTSLGAVTIPDSVTSIKTGAFEQAPLADVYYDGSENEWTGISISSTGNAPLTSANIHFSRSGSCGTGLSWVLSEEGVLMISGSGSLPDYDSGASPWYPKRAMITSVVFPGGLTAIGSYAFSGCYSLSSMTIPDSVTSIADGAFAGCSGLTQLSIPGSVTSIGDAAFSGCHSLSSVTIPGNVSTIGSAFAGCEGLSSVTLYSGVQTIAGGAFAGCVALEKITIPSSVTTIVNGAFSSCDGLSDIYYGGRETQWLALVGEEPESTIAQATVHFGYSSGFDISYLTYTVKNSAVTITGYTGELPAALVIPAGIDGKPVTAIGSSAFYGCSGLTSVTIPAGVTSIGDWAFSCCSALASVTIPATVTSPGFETFSGCPLLTTAGPGAGNDIAFGWTEALPNYAFSGCANLVNISIPDTVTSIGDAAFSGCSSLTSLCIPDGVTSIGLNAFSGCAVLAQLSIPASVTSVGASAFSGCAALISAGPEGSGCTYEFGWTESIPANAFSGCSALTGVTIPASVTSIGSNAFSGCSLLTSAGPADGDYCIKLCWSESIPANAFAGCLSLSDVAIPTSVTSIGARAFSGCTALSHVVIPASVTSLGSNVFFNCSRLKTAGPDGGGYNIEFGWTAAIPAYAFYGSNLTSILIPFGIRTVGNYAFYNCTSFSSVYYCGSSSQWSTVSIGSNNLPLKNAQLYYGYAQGSSVPYLLYTEDSGELSITGYTENLPTSFTLPRGIDGKAIVGIDSGAFRNCTWLTGIVIQSDVTTIGSEAFAGCDALASITLPSSLTTLGNAAFSGCNALSSVTVPGSVTILGTAFRGCTGLTDVTLSSGIQAIDAYAFENCTALSSITIPGTVTSVGNMAFSDCSSLAKLIIPASVQTVAFQAFSGCTALKTAGPRGGGYDYEFGWTTDIPANAFSCCAGLTSVTLPSGLKTIGEKAFACCSNLTSVNIPDGATSLGDFAFSDCRALSKVTVPASVTSIGDSVFSDCPLKTAGPRGGGYDYEFGWTTEIPRMAFYRCKHIRSAEIPEGVTSIGGSAFAGCSELAGVTIPTTVNSISANAFDSCSSLSDVFYRGDEQQWNRISISYYYNSYLISAARHYFCRSSDELPYLSWTLKEDGTIAITGFSDGLPAELIIPGAIDCVDVTEISASAFENAVGLETVSVPSSVSAIGDRAFAGCSALASISLPSTLTSIGERAFADCAKLAEITIPDTVTSIGDGAFSGCSSLGEVTIPGGVTAIGNAFAGCVGLTKVTLESGVTTIGENAFAGCAKLAEIAIPDTVTSIGDGAFSGCSALTELALPAALTTIGDGAFSGCTGLATLTVPAGVTSIGARAFAECSGLESLYFMGDAPSFGEGALTGTDMILYRLPDADWPEDALAGAGGNIIVAYSTQTPCGEDLVWGVFDNSVLRIIGTGAMTDYAQPEDTPWFSLGDTITEIRLDEGVTHVGDYAFAICPEVTKISLPSTLQTVGSFSFAFCSALPDAVIPDSVTSVGPGAFAGCSSLSEVQVPFSAVIGAMAFRECDSLGRFVLTPGSGRTLVYTAETAAQLPWNDPARTGLEVRLADGVQNIGDYTFAGSPISEIILPDSVAKIGANAFLNCSQMTFLQIPVSAEIAGTAFDQCDNLKKFYLTAGTGIFSEHTLSTYTDLPWNKPNLTADQLEIQFLKGIKTIGDYAFYKNTRIGMAILPDSIVSIGSYAFSDCPNLLYVKFPEQLTSVGDYAFHNCFKLMDLTLPEGLRHIGSHAFAGNESTLLTTIIIPDSVNELGAYAFSSIAGVKRVQLPSGLTEIPAGLFEKDFSLTFMAIPDGVHTIGNYAFQGCYALHDVIIPEGVKTIGRQTFFMTGHNTVLSVSLPQSLTSIGTGAFANSGLFTIRIPKNVTSIELGAFMDCVKLSSVYMDRTGTLSIGTGAFRDCGSLADVYYAAGSMQWSSYVSIADENEPLENAEFHFNNRDELTSGILLRSAQGEKVNYQTLIFDLSASGTMTLSYEILPEGASTKLSWACSEDTLQFTVDAGSRTVNLKGLKTGTGFLQVSDLKSGANTTVFFQSVRRVRALTISGDGNGKIGLEYPLQLSVITEPANATNKEVEWSLVNGTGEAEISRDGVITATKLGTVTVTATARDGSGVTASKTLEITHYGIDAPEELAHTSLCSGGKLQLQAAFVPANLYGTAIRWSISPADSQFASVSATGLVTAKTVTEMHCVTVTASAADGSASLDFLVDVYPKVQSVVVTDAAGETVTGKTVFFDLNRSGLAELRFAASVLPDDAGQDVSWSMADKNKKKVAVFRDNGDGTVTVQPNGSGKTGVVTLTAKAKDGSGKKAAVKVSFVRLAQEQQLFVTNAPAALRGGASLTLKTNIGGIAALTNRTLTWELDDASAPYASISGGGKLTTFPVDVPTPVTVTVWAKDNPDARTSVTITLVPAVQSVTLRAAGDTLYVGLKSHLIASVLPEKALSAGTWSSSNAKIASVTADGTVTAKKPGTVTISFTAADGSKKSGFVRLTVIAEPAVPVESITSNMPGGVTELELDGGQSAQLSAQVLPENASNKALVWTSDKPAFATVSAKGVVTAKKVCADGWVFITAAAADGSGKSATFRVHVRAGAITPVESIALSGGDAVISGKTLALKAALTPAKPTTAALAWSSSNPEAAGVSAKGVVTALPVSEPTSVVITAAATDGSNVRAEKTVTVYPRTTRVDILLDGDVVNNTVRTLDTAETAALSLRAVCEPVGRTMDVPVTWKSSNAKIASIAADGTVTAKKAGTVTITARAADGSGASAGFKLVVRASVHSLQIRESGCELRGGAKLTLHADFTPVKPTNAKVIWRLRPQDTSYASISSKGVLTAKAVTGVHTVMVTAVSKEDPGKSAAVAVKLYPAVGAVRLYHNDAEVTKQTLTVKLADCGDGIRLEALCFPTEAADGVSWKSSSAKIATVSDGLVTVRKKGTVKITVTAADGSKKSAVVTIKIV